MPAAIPILTSIAPLAATSEAWIVDIWGVMHNGARAFEAAGDWRVRLAGAVEEGQAAMAEREAELRALLAEPGSGDG